MFFESLHKNVDECSNKGGQTYLFVRLVFMFICMHLLFFDL